MVRAVVISRVIFACPIKTPMSAKINVFKSPSKSLMIVLGSHNQQRRSRAAIQSRNKKKADQRGWPWHRHHQDKGKGKGKGKGK